MLLPVLIVNTYEISRESSATSYLSAVLGNGKLKIYAHTTAKKITFSGTTANGVQVKTLGLNYRLTAKKEVIVSAGAFQSPQILMASGIGPQGTLQANGISVVKNLPGVGQNLQDHILFGVTHPVNVITATRVQTDTLYAAEQLVNYLAKQGPLTNPGFGIVGFEKLPATSRANFSASTQAHLANLPADYPEVEYITVDGIVNGLRSADDQNVADGNNYGALGGALMAPKSRGTVSISSSDTETPPVIDLGYLTDPADQEVVVALFKRLRAAWAQSNISTGPEYAPGAAVQSDAEILAYIQDTVAPVWHASGTCKMVSIHVMTIRETFTDQITGHQQRSLGCSRQPRSCMGRQKFESGRCQYLPNASAWPPAERGLYGGREDRGLHQSRAVEVDLARSISAAEEVNHR